MSDVLKEKGNDSFKQGDYTTADALYKGAIALNPTDPVLYSNRAMTLIKLSQWKECIEVCDVGLSNSPEPKTKAKLLWRRGTAFLELNDFVNARKSLQLGLELYPTDPHILKSIEKLNSSEKQYNKRSHSISELDADKRPKKPNSSSLERIPIYEVDELPSEFNPTGTKSSLKATATTKPHTELKAQPQPEQKLEKNLSTQAAELNNAPAFRFPEVPTSYQLSSIIKNTQTYTVEFYKYILSISPSAYEKVYQGGSIDSQFLNTFISASIHFLQNDPSKYLDKVISLANAITSVPRFNLVKILIDKAKLGQLQNLIIQNNGSSTALQNWS